MVLRTIVCSGANEHTDLSALVDLMLLHPQMELGIQVSEEKANANSERCLWIWRLYHKLKEAYYIPTRVALHLNRSWVEDFCSGNVPQLVDTLLQLSIQDRPFITRVQLNFKIGREKKPDADFLTETIRKYPQQRFILSYNSANAKFIRKLYEKEPNFDCLYDDSFGEGLLPKKRKAPAFDDVFQGYAGGLTPENVCAELGKIAKLIPLEREIFIDAEGGLKDETGHFSIDKCRKFIMNVQNYLTKQNPPV